MCNRVNFLQKTGPIKVGKTKQNTRKTAVFRVLFGGDYGTRTCDLMRVKHAL